MIRAKRKASRKDANSDKDQGESKSDGLKVKNKENALAKRSTKTRKNAKSVPIADADQQNEKPKYVPKLKTKVYGDNSSFFDSIYHAIKTKKEEQLKFKRKEQRDRLKALKNVEISTPVNRYKLKNDLHFDISPISLKNSSLELPSKRKSEDIVVEPAKKEPKILTVKVPDKSRRLTDVIRISVSEKEIEEKSLTVPEIVVESPHEVSKHKVVHFNDSPEEKQKDRDVDGMNKSLEKINLKPGKWRRSLAAWRKSHNPAKIMSRPSKRFIALFPIRTDPGVVEMYKKKLHETLEKSALLEQSDEGRLQAELSILDSSVECSPINKSYVLQRKTSQRETSIFKKSSIFFGLSSPLIDVDVLSSLSAQQVVLRRCRQQEPLPFDDIYSESQLPNCKKIGEGVYGEVFMYKPADDDPIVLKIIPIEGDLIVNGGPQKRFSEILSEIVIAEELSALSNGKENKTDGFVRIKRVHCVKGAYPQHLLDAWEIYNDSSLRGSENDNPDIFDEDQLYIVFEQYNAGIDLEAFVFKNAEEAFSLFIQVALTLAVAENKFEFEHRDLHWGNILIARTNEKTLKYHVDGKVYEIPSCGVKCTIIDFTLSRMVYDGAVIYDNLAKDQELFESSGDYQFDIYRLMRYRLENDFKRYDPYTNLLWLHYLIDKLIDGARYKYSKSDKHKTAVNKMMQLRDTLLEDNQSAYDFVKSLKN